MHWIRFLKKSEKIWRCCVTPKALIAAIQQFIFNKVWILKCLRRLFDHSTISKSFETLFKSNWLHAATTGTKKKRGGIWEGAPSSYTSFHNSAHSTVCCHPFNLKLKPSTSQPTHFREIFWKSSHQMNTNKGSIVKQSGNDVEGCRSEKVLVQPNMHVFLNTV